MTLVRDVVADARRQFMTTQRDRFNTLASDITATATTITVSYDTAALNSITGIVAGAVLEIDLESILVAAVSGTTLTVLRGMDGSSKAAHKAGALVRIDPILRDRDLFVALNHELRALSSPAVGLFQVGVYDFTVTGNLGLDLPLPLRTGASIIDVLFVRWKEPRGEWPQLNGWRFQRAALLGDFPSGFSIHFTEDLPAGRPARVWYMASFGLVDTLTDEVEDVTGIMTEAVDILALGAAIRTADPREIGRNFHERQGSPRRATEVNAGAQLQSPAALRQHYAARRSEERARLHRMWKHQVRL